MIKKVTAKVRKEAYGKAFDNLMHFGEWKPTLNKIKAVYPNKEDHESNRSR